MILIPRLVGNACLLLKSVLTAPRLDDCRRQTQRSYDRVDGDPNGMREKMTGANLLDVTYVGASLALLTDDQPLLLDALSRSYNEAEYTPGQADGIKVRQVNLCELYAARLRESLFQSIFFYRKTAPSCSTQASC